MLIANSQTRALVGLAGQPEATSQPIKFMQSVVKRKSDEEAEAEAKTKRGRASANGDEVQTIDLAMCCGFAATLTTLSGRRRELCETQSWRASTRLAG